jgi:hypothetical protein
MLYMNVGQTLQSQSLVLILSFTERCCAVFGS